LRARARELLVEAQEQCAWHQRQRNEADHNRVRVVRTLTAALRAAAPAELTNFLTELKWLKNSAAFQLGFGRPLPTQIRDAISPHDFAAANLAKLELFYSQMVEFQRRVNRAQPLAEALVFQPTGDVLGRVAELRGSLEPIPEVVSKGWSDVGQDFLAMWRNR